MKTLQTTIAVALLAAAGVAQAEFSANIGATSNYIWRGVTQTDNGAAISGGVDYSNDSGLYAGVWASNVDFAPATGHELDLYFGFAGAMEGFDYDLGAIFYTYSEDNINFTELTASVSTGPVSAGLAYTIDTDAGGNDNHKYYWIGAGTDLTEGFSVAGTVGRYDFDGGNAGDYTHYSVDVSKGDFTFTLSDTNITNDDLNAVVSWGMDI